MTKQSKGPTRSHPYRGLRKPSKPRSSYMDKYYTNKPVYADGMLTRTNISTPDFGTVNTTVDKSNQTLGVVNISRNGSNIPGYKYLITTQQDASSGYSRRDYTIDSVPGNVQYVYYDSSIRSTLTEMVAGWLLYPNNGSWPTASSNYSASLDSQAQTQFLAKLYQKQTTFQGGIFLGELREAIHGIRHPLASLYNGSFDFLKAVRRRAASGKIRRAPTVNGKRLSILTKMLSDTWLEFSFGWAPLVNDLDNAAQALSYLTQRSPTEHIVGSATKETVTTAVGGLFACGYNTYTLQERTALNTKVKYTGGLHATIDNATSGLSAKDLGVGLNDFVPTIWELIPYSFLIDYFINVGQVLEASMASTAGLFYLSKSVKTTNTLDVLAMTKVDGLGNSGVVGSVRRISEGGQLGECRLTYSAYDRYAVQPGSLAPSLRFKLPIDKPLKLLNMAALVGAGRSTSRYLTNIGRS